VFKKIVSRLNLASISVRKKYYNKTKVVSEAVKHTYSLDEFAFR